MLSFSGPASALSAMASDDSVDFLNFLFKKEVRVLLTFPSIAEVAAVTASAVSSKAWKLTSSMDFDALDWA